MKKKYKILLVDNDEHILKINYDLLESKGYEVTTVSSGENAIEAIRLNVDDYLFKPFRGEDLLVKISSCLKRGVGRQEKQNSVA